MELLTKISSLMPAAMAVWLAAGLVFLARDVLAVRSDERLLDEVDAIGSQAQDSDYLLKMELRMQLVQWADLHKRTSMARWLYSAHNTALIGAHPDASAVTDAIWSYEKERHFTFRFFSRNAILLGLLFTSIGLCRTLTSIAPALGMKSANFNLWLDNVQVSMSGALEGMATAFYSSLGGIGITLFLNLLALMLLTWRHERYLSDLDGIMQGNIIPIFTAIVEKDRNDVIREAMDRAYGAFGEVKTQYESFLGLWPELLNLREAVELSTQTLTRQMAAFGMSVSIISESARKFDTISDAVSRAVDKGLGSVRDANDKLLSSFTTFQDDTLKPLTVLVSTQYKEQQELAQEILQALNRATKDLASTSDTLHGELKGIVPASKEMGKSLVKLSKSVTDASKDLRGQVTAFQQSGSAYMGEIAAAQVQQGETITTLYEEIRGVAGHIDEAVKALSETREQQHKLVIESYNLHREEISRSYGAVVGQLREAMVTIIAAGSTEMQAHLSSGVNQALSGVFQQLQTLDQNLHRLVAAHDAGVSAMSGIRDGLTLSKDDIEADLQVRRAYLDTALSRITDAASERFALQSEHLARGLSHTLGDTLQNSLLRQEQIIADLNHNMGKKWDDLLTAYMAASGLDGNGNSSAT